MRLEATPDQPEAPGKKQPTDQYVCMPTLQRNKEDNYPGTKRIRWWRVQTMHPEGRKCKLALLELQQLQGRHSVWTHQQLELVVDT